MKYVETIEIAVDEIDDTDRLRQVNHDWIEALAESIAKIGQKEPVEVVAQKRNGKQPYRLIAGGHRLAACRLAGLDTIRAEVKAPETDNADLEIRLHEIDENLIRHELNALDRAVFLGERKKVYEAMYPDAARGVAGGKARQGSATDIVSFAESTAEKIDLTERTIQRATAIYERIPADIRAGLHGTPLARNQGELIKLTRYSPEQQKKIVAACTRPENPSPSVAVAAQELAGREQTGPSPEDVYFKGMQKKFGEASPENKEAFLEWLQGMGIVKAFDAEMLT